jgi:hypothetical protein
MNAKGDPPAAVRHCVVSAEDDATRPGAVGQIGGWGIYSDLRLRSTGELSVDHC